MRKNKKDQVIAEDMQYIKRRAAAEEIEGSTVMVSGATGLIGKYLVWFLAGYCNCRVIVVARDKEKAGRLFGRLGEKVIYIYSDITELKAMDMAVDYMIHGASITSSRDFAAHPAEVIHTSVEGTWRMLEFARKNPVKGFVYLSTMEVYGTPQTERKICEKDGTDLDTMSPRSCYPESKRLCESLCAAYCSEYGVPARVLRLTQTFGPGVEYEDGRVFAGFARCVAERKDIILHTAGETKRNYLYLADACTAIFAVMTKGENGEAYNGANEDAYCSIKEMAEMVAEEIAGGRIRVRTGQEGGAAKERGYAPVFRMNLDTGKLQGLGWRPEIGLPEMYGRMISSMDKEMNGNRRGI